jgi:pimeloyl-ACP methyl ester carboxylesterase
MLALGLPIRLVQAKCETDDRFCEIAHLPQITYRRERGPTDTIAWGGDRCTFIWEEISAQERQQATAPKKTDTKASGEAKPQDKYLTVNNLRLHYVDWNNYGWQTMLILHDIMDESHSWDPFASHFEQTHHVVALDQRGRGDSEWSPENAYGFDDCVEDIAQVFDALKPGPMILVGHSIGGVVAMKYTMLHPETVSHLVIIDMPPSAPKRMMRSIRQMMSEFREEYESMDEITAAYRPAPPHWTEEMLSQLVQHRVRVKPDGRLEMKFDHKGIVSADAKGVGLFSWDLWKSLGMIKCPTLIVSSGRGPSFLSSRVAHKFRKSLANGIVIHMKHVSHTAHIEDAPALAHVVSEFLIDSKDKSQ